MTDPVGSPFYLGQRVLRKGIPEYGVGIITTPPFESWPRIRGHSIERVAWADGGEGIYHSSELIPA